MLPASDAWMVHKPWARMVTVLPPTAQTAGVKELKVTALPEAPPVALTVNGGLPSVPSKGSTCPAWNRNHRRKSPSVTSTFAVPVRARALAASSGLISEATIVLRRVLARF